MDSQFDNWLTNVFELGESDSTLEQIIQLFENPAEPLARFSDEQLKSGFWVLCEGGGPMQSLLDEAIPWEIRLRAIRSFVPLFRDLFAVRATQTLSHLCRPGQTMEEPGPVNSPCYMWWDFDCWAAQPGNPLNRRLDAAFLDDMRDILAIPHEACRESALHGLGHWSRSYPLETERIIDEFLELAAPLARHGRRKRPAEKRIEIREELRRYALAARCGCVL